MSVHNYIVVLTLPVHMYRGRVATRRVGGSVSRTASRKMGGVTTRTVGSGAYGVASEGHGRSSRTHFGKGT